MPASSRTSRTAASSLVSALSMCPFGNCQRPSELVWISTILVESPSLRYATPPAETSSRVLIFCSVRNGCFDRAFYRFVQFCFERGVESNDLSDHYPVAVKNRGLRYGALGLENVTCERTVRIRKRIVDLKFFDECRNLLTVFIIAHV